MNTQPSPVQLSLRRVPLLAGAALVLALGAPAGADDVDLISNGQQDPYVFLLLDVSGSMGWSIPCTAADLAETVPPCSYLCTDGECEPPLVADDPQNRLYVAKEALYELMNEIQGFNFGFATFDQDALEVEWKHWWYELTGRSDGMAYTGVTLANNFTILAPPVTDATGAVTTPGERHIFGQRHICEPNSGGAISRGVGCTAANPAMLDNPWAFERVRRWSKLDEDNDTNRPYYVRAPDGSGGGTTYRINFKPDNTVTQIPGDPVVTALLDVEQCTNSNCTSRTTLHSNLPLSFAKREDIIRWDWDPPVNVPTGGNSGFMFDVQYIPSKGGQNGWEHVGDTSNDEYPSGTYNLKYLPVTDPLGRGPAYLTGDVLPWDWQSDHRRDIQLRMAPNLIVDASATPDFGIARYFQDFRQSGETFMRLETQFYDPTNPNTPDAKPLLPSGGTPTGASMASFRSWFGDWVLVADDPDGDIDLDCKTLNLIVVTDGQASDGNDACDEATALLDLATNGTTYHLRTFVLALGDENLATSGFTNVLDCMADNGGTSDDPAIDDWPPGGDGNVDQNGDPITDGPGPLFAKNRDEIVDQLTRVLTIIGGSSKSFSAAAVERASSNVEEKIVLSSLVPVPENNVWPGRVDAYLKPLPRKTVTIDGEARRVPDRDERCTGPNDDGCLLWDAGEQIVLQAPTDAQVDAGDFNLGNGPNERRVFYASPNLVGVPDARVMLDTPTATADWENLTEALGICTADPTDATVLQTCAADSARQTEAIDVLEFLYRRKSFEDPDTMATTEYVLGEVFHSIPTLAGSPDSFRFFVQDRNNYRAYFTEHRFRRKMLAVNSNDGLLHVFDAGIYRGDEDDGDFDNGTGRELFAFAPREPMPKLVEMANPNLPPEHRYLVDGSPAHFDVLIDPQHNGTPDPDDREWRTVILSGLREGGASYYALDVTEPDNRDSDNVPDVSSGTGYLPTANGFPTLLWEFRDRGNCAGLTLGQTDPVNFPNDPRCDDDPPGDPGYKLPDLGDTWSTPGIGTIRVCEDSACNTVVEKFVMVAGGGMDPDNKTAVGKSGNYLYMIDVETGQAIYKRRLGNGSAPSEPAIVDKDKDGVLDTIYVGTTAGELFKVDIRDPQPLVTVGGALRVTDAAWSPFKIFDTGGRPIYFPPAVIFIPDPISFALAFGSGDREDLWSGVGQTTANGDGRFYMVLDTFTTFDPSNPPTPLTETALTQISLASGNSPNSNFLNPGWFFPLLDDERLISPASAILGVTVFSTFQPTITQVQNAICASRGSSKVYVVLTTNGDAVADDRFEVVKSLLSETFADVGAIDNRPDDDDDDCGDGPGQEPCPPEPSCHDSERSDKIALELLKFFPRNCRFTGETICLQATEDTTNIKVLAPIPICTTLENWKEL
jgi:hypothetical protein